MKLAKNLLLTALLVFALIVFVDFVRFPECYVTTWKYQLQNDIKSGDAVAIEYYNNTYVENGRTLFE